MTKFEGIKKPLWEYIIQLFKYIKYIAIISKMIYNIYIQ